MLSEPEICLLIHDTLELPESCRLTPNTRIADVPGWDSLGWVEVITIIERECGMEFDVERIETFETIADLIKFVHQSSVV